ncbi:MAG: hypothetical protein AAFZ65_12020, partial [Planctomycetota bacterium]
MLRRAPNRLAVAFVGGLLAAGCGRREAPPGPVAVPVGLDPLASSRVVVEHGGSQVERELLRGLGSAQDWVAASGLAARQQGVLRGESTWSDGVLELSGQQIGLFRCVPLPDEAEWVRVELDVQSLGRTGRDDGHARFGVLELAASELPEDLAQALPWVRGQHFADAREQRDDGPARESLTIAVGEETEALVLVCESIDPTEVGVGGRFADLRVTLVGAGPSSRCSRASAKCWPRTQGRACAR